MRHWTISLLLALTLASPVGAQVFPVIPAPVEVQEQAGIPNVQKELSRKIGKAAFTTLFGVPVDVEARYVRFFKAARSREWLFVDEIIVK